MNVIRQTVLCALIAVFSTTAIAAPVPTQFVFSFSSGESVLIEQIEDRFVFSECDQSGACKGVGRQSGYTTKELTSAQASFTWLSRLYGAINGTISVCAALLAGGVAVASPFLVGAVLPYEIGTPIMVIGFAAIPVTFFMGSMMGLIGTGAIVDQHRPDAAQANSLSGGMVYNLHSPHHRSMWRQLVESATGSPFSKGQMSADSSRMTVNVDASQDTAVFQLKKVLSRIDN